MIIPNIKPNEDQEREKAPSGTRSKNSSLYSISRQSPDKVKNSINLEVFFTHFYLRT